MPQDGKYQTEVVGVQAGHETAHIVERLAKCEGFDERQHVALFPGHGIRVPGDDLCVEPGDSSVVGSQPWLTPLHESPTARPDQQLDRSASVEWHPCAQFRSSAAIAPPLAADVVRLIVVDLLGSDDASEFHAPWPHGQPAENALLPFAARVRWA